MSQVEHQPLPEDDRVSDAWRVVSEVAHELIDQMVIGSGIDEAYRTHCLSVAAIRDTVRMTDDDLAKAAMRELELAKMQRGLKSGTGKPLLAETWARFVTRFRAEVITDDGSTDLTMTQIVAGLRSGKYRHDIS